MYALLHMHFYAPYAGMLFEGLYQDDHNHG